MTMRASGVVGSARGLAPYGHLCWAYADRAEFRVRAAEYLADGIAAGQWIEYVGSGSDAALRAELVGLGCGVIDRDGGVGVRPVEEFYDFSDDSGVVDPVASVTVCVAAVEKALADGYTGFRAVVDATAVARTATQRAAFARFEYLIDQKMAALPVAGLCAYDIGELGAPAVAELACLHPFVNEGSTGFRLYAEPGVAFALAGEIDLACAEQFATTLARVVTLSSGPELVVDGHRLEFIDHRGLLGLIEQARCAGATLAIRNARGLTTRLITVLDLEGVRVEVGT